VPSLNVKQHTAIPRTDRDPDGSSLSSDNTKSITTHLQAIAFTAGFHFAFIEVGGTGLYPTLAQKFTNLEVLRILLSIGPSENHAFPDLAGQSRQALPITDADIGFPGSTGATVSFADLTQAQGETNPESLNGDTLQANLIMPCDWRRRPTPLAARSNSFCLLSPVSKDLRQLVGLGRMKPEPVLCSPHTKTDFPSAPPALFPIHATITRSSNIQCSRMGVGNSASENAETTSFEELG